MEDGGGKKQIRSFVFELRDNEIEIANLPNLATLCKRKTRDDRCGRNKGKLI